MTNTPAHTKINITLKGIHEYNDPIEALQNAEGIFTGGGILFTCYTALQKQFT
jgi:dipeptidase E